MHVSFIGSLKTHFKTITYQPHPALYHRLASSPNKNHFQGIPIPYGQKLDPSGVCFGWNVLALSGKCVFENAFSWKPKKLTKSIVRNGDVSLFQNSTKHSQCASEARIENSCEILSLKVWNNPPLAPVPFRAFFGLMVGIFCGKIPVATAPSVRTNHPCHPEHHHLGSAFS